MGTWVRKPDACENWRHARSGNSGRRPLSSDGVRIETSEVRTRARTATKCTMRSHGSRSNDHEGIGIGIETVRKVPHYSPQGHRARDLHEPPSQAAAGLNPRARGQRQKERRACRAPGRDRIKRKKYGKTFGSRFATRKARGDSTHLYLRDRAYDKPEAAHAVGR